MNGTTAAVLQGLIFVKATNFVVSVYNVCEYYVGVLS